MSGRTAAGLLMVVLGIALALYGIIGMNEFSQSFDAAIAHKTDARDMLAIAVGVVVALIGVGLLGNVIARLVDADFSARLFAERLLGVFISPTETFADVARKPGFWAPLIAIMLGSVAVVETMLWKIGAERIVRMSIEQSSRASSMTPEQIDQAVSQGAKIAGISMHIVGFLGPPIGLLIFAGLGMLIVNVIFGAQASFKTVFSLVCYADLVSLVGALMGVAMTLFGDPEHINPNNPIPSTIGFFLNPREVSKPLYAVASSADFLTLWLLILLGLALSEGTGRKVKPLPITLVYTGFWLVWVLIKIGLAFIG